MSAPLAVQMAGIRAYRRWEDRKRIDIAASPRDLVTDVWVACRRVGAVIDETAARSELTAEMLDAGVITYCDWERRRAGIDLKSVDELLAGLLAAFLRAGSNYSF
jgi:hypothetical protein